MISKRITGEYKGKQATKNVISYVADKAIENMTNYTTNKTEKAWYINLPNDKELAIAKMQNTQAMNTHTTTSKIYHYTVTFQNGEKPNDDIMLNIEKTMSEALGYKEYQRVIAIHDDTAHYHMHIVINTIHPTKYINKNSPSNDYYIRNDNMRMLEKKYNLAIDNGIGEKGKIRDNKNYKAIDFESHTGLESFTTYLKREIKENALNANNWQELHQQAKKIGVIVKLQGNGLVFKSINSKVTVKASDIDRKLSKSNLEKKLGIFTEIPTQDLNKNVPQAQDKPINEKVIPIQEASKNNALESLRKDEKNSGVEKTQKTYEKLPKNKNSDELWKKYLEFKQNVYQNNKHKKEILNKLFALQNIISKNIWSNKNLTYREKNNLKHQINIVAIENKYKVYGQNLDNDAKNIYDKFRDKFIKLEIAKYEKLEKIKHSFLSRQEKLNLISKTQEIYKTAFSQLKIQIKKEIMHKKHNSLSWIDFVRKEVKNHNVDAIKTLQYLEKKEYQDILKNPYIAGVKTEHIILENENLQNAKIGKSGTISYETKDGGLFIDEKYKITILKISPQAEQQAYELAQKQFKHTMKIQGNLAYWNKQQGLER